MASFPKIQKKQHQFEEKRITFITIMYKKSYDMALLRCFQERRHMKQSSEPSTMELVVFINLDQTSPYTPKAKVLLVENDFRSNCIYQKV